MKRTILITGAAGNIGAKLAAHFNTTKAYDLRLLDQRAGEGITAADLSVWDETWPKLFEGVDTVIHLAGEPSGKASWARVHKANIVATQHVLRAAREARIRRVVFASTNQVMLGYRFRTEDPVTTDLPPLPLSPYGVSKLFGEELGRGFAEETGISFVALRIGYFQRGENLPGPHMQIGLWGQHDAGGGARDRGRKRAVRHRQSRLQQSRHALGHRAHAPGDRLRASGRQRAGARAAQPRAGRESARRLAAAGHLVQRAFRRGGGLIRVSA
jgi:nucleoside-diphosphate-sugar epimerase